MVGGVDPIQVDGLREYRRSIKAIDAGLPKQLTKAMKVVGTETRDESRTVGRRTYVHKATVKGIKSSSAGPKVTMILDARKVEDLLGNEFGGGRYGPGNPSPRGGHTTQFKAHRGSGADAGYAFFPTIRKRQQRENPELVEDVLSEFFEDNGL